MDSTLLSYNALQRLLYGGFVHQNCCCLSLLRPAYRASLGNEGSLTFPVLHPRTDIDHLELYQLQRVVSTLGPYLTRILLRPVEHGGKQQAHPILHLLWGESLRQRTGVSKTPSPPSDRNGQIIFLLWFRLNKLGRGPAETTYRRMAKAPGLSCIKFQLQQD